MFFSCFALTVMASTLMIGVFMFMAFKSAKQQAIASEQYGHSAAGGDLSGGPVDGRCPYCDIETPASATSCPSCGATF